MISHCSIYLFGVTKHWTHVFFFIPKCQVFVPISTSWMKVLRFEHAWDQGLKMFENIWKTLSFNWKWFVQLVEHPLETFRDMIHTAGGFLISMLVYVTRNHLRSWECVYENWTWVCANMVELLPNLWQSSSEMCVTRSSVISCNHRQS